MGIPSDKYQEDWKLRLRREKKGLFFTNFRSATPARRQVTLLANCVYRGQGGGIIYIRETGLKVSVKVTAHPIKCFSYCSYNTDLEPSLYTLYPHLALRTRNFRTASPDDAPEFRIANLWKINLFPDAASISSLLGIKVRALFFYFFSKNNQKTA